jgi:hypothetical protein
MIGWRNYYVRGCRFFECIEYSARCPPDPDIRNLFDDVDVRLRFYVNALCQLLPSRKGPSQCQRWGDGEHLAVKGWTFSLTLNISQRDAFLIHNM